MGLALAPGGAPLSVSSKGVNMPTFVTLVKLTPEGAKAIGDGRKRYERYERLIKEAGGRVVSAHGLLGQYDLITVAELPDEQTAVRVALSVGALGTVTTQTMTALPIKEFFDQAEKSAQTVGAVGARVYKPVRLGDAPLFPELQN